MVKKGQARQSNCHRIHLASLTDEPPIVAPSMRSRGDAQSPPRDSTAHTVASQPESAADHQLPNWQAEMQSF